MRISDQQKKAILESVAAELGADARVFLFGSRVDDTKRGGDIDLFVEIPFKIDNIVRKKLRILSQIQRRIGEQKIDLIITYLGEFSEENLPLVIKNAQQDGILL
ncbi:MAG: nucleotidyltransferase domain-containing protein [Deltaproteobacteria bacterium]|jgi:predicted nucleotidyltransferase|nr:nucleotidyltransferase domain-containing protein [Deltaproteobacteria bacterium]MBT6615184.1 nucleotidyltransferase domain-containing protein [Deltaproteobacteria bacterium]